MNQATAQVEKVKQGVARLIEEGVKAKELEAEQIFAERMRQHQIQMQTMAEQVQIQINNIHEKMKSDYALELSTTKLNMAERTEQQQKHMEDQENNSST